MIAEDLCLPAYWLFSVSTQITKQFKMSVTEDKTTNVLLIDYILMKMLSHISVPVLRLFCIHDPY